MKTLKEFQGNLSEYPNDKQKEILNTFVNELIMDLNAPLSVEEIDHLRFRVYEKLGSGISIKYLIKLHNEIISSYKRYVPLCYASIVTASTNLSAKF